MAGYDWNWMQSMAKPGIHSMDYVMNGSVGDDYQMSPLGGPKYTGVQDASGNMRDEYLLRPQGDINSNLDQTALNKLRGEATTAPGTSAWESLMNQRQDVTDQQGRDTANRNAASGNESALSQLATSGGASGGARERLAKASALNSAEARQGVASNSAAARLGIGAQAEQNRLGLLSAQPGQELGAANYKTGIDTSNRDYNTGINSFNIGNQLNQNTLSNAFNLQKYNSQMQDWAATTSANANKNSGKGASGK